MQPWQLEAAELARRIAARELSCVEAVRSSLERLEAVNPRINAVVDGGAEALRSIDVVRLQLEGETWPRLQMPTAAPPFEAGRQQEELLLDLKNNRMKLWQKGSGAGFEGDNTIVIQSGQGANYDNRAHTITPIPVAQSSQQQFVQFYRRLPHLLLRTGCA